MMQKIKYKMKVSWCLITNKHISGRFYQGSSHQGMFHCSSFCLEYLLPEMYEWLTPHLVQASVQMFSLKVSLIISAKAVPTNPHPNAAVFLFMMLTLSLIHI